MSLCLIPKILNPIDVALLISKQLTVINPVMLKLGHIQRIVTTKIISVDDSVSLHFLPNNRQQCVRPGIGNYHRENLALTLQ